MFNVIKRALRYVFRDAGTGRFVRRDYARQNPKTTVKETVTDAAELAERLKKEGGAP